MEEPSESDNQGVTTDKMNEQIDRQSLTKDEETLQATFQNERNNTDENESKSYDDNVNTSFEDPYDENKVEYISEGSFEINKKNNSSDDHISVTESTSNLDDSFTGQKVANRVDSESDRNYQLEEQAFSFQDAIENVASVNQFTSISPAILIGKNNSMASLEENSTNHSIKVDGKYESNNKQNLNDIEPESEEATAQEIEMTSCSPADLNQKNDQLSKTTESSLDNKGRPQYNLSDQLDAVEKVSVTDLVENSSKKGIIGHQTDSINMEQTKNIESQDQKQGNLY